MRAKTTILILITTLLTTPVLGQAFSKASTQIPGIMGTRERYEGVLANLVVEVQNGTGRVFVETMPLTEIDTQASARLSKEVACNTLSKNCSQYDFLYVVRSEAPIIGGPSAGASLAGATLAALTNKSINQSVMMTGTINPDGSVGQVGSLFEKAEAAYQGGATKFLVPRGQAEVVGRGGQTLREYASQEWGMSVVEVSDVEDVYEHLTGYQIVREPVSETISTQVYDKLMKNMSEKLVSYTQDHLESLESKLEGTTIPYDRKREIEQGLQDQKEILNTAQTTNALGDHYSAASYGVRASISLVYYENLIDYLSSDSEKVFAKELADNVSDEIEGMDERVTTNTTLQSLYDIELLLVSTDRVREAERIMEESYKYYYNGDYAESVYESSFARVRTLTSQLWYGMIGVQEGNISVEFDPRRLETFAYERYRQAQDAQTYTNTIYGATPTVTEHLTRADEAIKSGKYVFSIFESTQALALSNLVLETSSMSVSQLQSVLADKEQNANEAISSARQKGLLPILAISYKEYAEQFEEDEPETALVYLSYSKQFADISEELLNAAQTGVIVEKPETKVVKKNTTDWSSIITSAGLVLLGFFLGLIFSVRVYKK